MSNYGSNIDLKQEHDVKIDFDTIETTVEDQTEKEREADLQRQLAAMANKSKSGVLQTGGNQRVCPRDRHHREPKDRFVMKVQRKTTQMEDCKQSSSSSSKEQPTLQLFKEKPKVSLFKEEPQKKKKVSLFITDDDDDDKKTDAMEDDYEIVQKPSVTKLTETFSLMTSDSRMDV